MASGSTLWPPISRILTCSLSVVPMLSKISSQPTHSVMPQTRRQSKRNRRLQAIAAPGTKPKSVADVP
jgi:hypothetical protein